MKASSALAFGKPTPLVLGWLVAAIGIYVGVGITLRAAPAAGGALWSALVLEPTAVASRPWTALSWAFLHPLTEPTVLVFNLLAVYVFGSDLERSWSRARLVGLAGATAAVGTLAVIGTSALGLLRGEAMGAPAIGSALIVAWCIAHRSRPIQVWFVPMMGWHLLLACLALELWGIVTAPSLTAAGQIAGLAVGAAWADGTALRTAILKRRLRGIERKRASLRVIPGGRSKPPPGMLN